MRASKKVRYTRLVHYPNHATSLSQIPSFLSFFFFILYNFQQSNTSRSSPLTIFLLSIAYSRKEDSMQVAFRAAFRAAFHCSNSLTSSLYLVTAISACFCLKKTKTKNRKPAALCYASYIARINRGSWSLLVRTSERQNVRN